MYSSVLTAIYLLWTLLTGSLIAIALAPVPKKMPHKHRYALTILSTAVTEAPQLFLALKAIALWWFKRNGVFSPDDQTQGSLNGSLWSQWVYMFDVVVFLGYWTLLLQLYYAKHAVDSATGVYKSAESTEAPGLWTAAFWLRVMNPFWVPRNVKVHTDICYATDEELNKAGPGMEAYLTLDVYHHPSYPRNRPVLIYIHEGTWKSGSKSFPIPPFIYYLALHKWVVISVNHRLSPTHGPYPTPLIDIKRAIRWTKKNVSKYGGDASFIAVAGTESGGHLAAMAALSGNDSYYFGDSSVGVGRNEMDDTVQACVCINSILDVSDNKKMYGEIKKRFAKDVAARRKDGAGDVSSPPPSVTASSKHHDNNLIEADDEFLKFSSPVMLLKSLEADKRRSVSLVGHGNVVGARSRASSSVTDLYSPAAGSPVVAGSVTSGSEGRPKGLVNAEQIPPFIIFHGAADSIVPVRHVRDFVTTMKKVTKSPFTYVEFPAADHLYNVIGARSHYMAYGIERFLDAMYRAAKKTAGNA
ncbi:hypothetical protein HDU76_013917 [Blyttiomyces sp. JEL0837]|nr:hypothetical protein HDU76_013917 [Blyttiomyces sp. JEL0837]